MKKFISLVLCLAMILSFATVFASAKGYTIFVDGQNYDAEKSQSGTGWQWNKNGTLTLDGYDGGAISITNNGVAKIVLNGDNAIDADDIGISSNGKLEISGKGSLTINAEGIGIETKDLTLPSGMVNVNSNTSYAISVYDDPDDDFRSSLTVSGAKVTATAKTHEAVWIDGTISVTAGKLAAKTDAEMPAIVSYAFTESYITSENETAWYDKDFGEYKVTVADDGAIIPDGTVFVPVNGKSGEAYSDETYSDETYSDESYTSDIYKDTSATGASWNRTGYFKMVASASAEKLTLDGKKWTYGDGYANDVVIAFSLNKLFTESNIIRTYGKNRMRTALAAAEALKLVNDVDKFDNIIIAAGADSNYADALSASYLASVKDAPILLALSNKDNTEVINYIYDNFTGEGNVYIIGGTSAVEASFENQLKQKLGVNASKILRLAGKNRYDTNIEILKEAGFVGDSLIVCTGEDFADALSASSLGLPILLVRNSKGSLEKCQRDYLSQSDIASAVKNIYFIGGNAAVKTSFEKTIKSYFSSAILTRFSGKNRYMTSKLVADKFFDGTEAIATATGENPADALAAGPVAYAMNAPVLLVSPKASKNASSSVVFAQDSMSDNFMMIFGGTAVVTDKNANDIISGDITLNYYPPVSK